MLTPDNKMDKGSTMRYDPNGKIRIRLRERLLCADFPFAIPLLAILAGLFLLACSNSARDVDNEYLIRVGEQVVTVSDFNKAFEITKSAYPHKLAESSVLLKEAQVRMLNQMIEELLVLQQAAELQIELNEAEVAKAIGDIKADYPEGVFEQMLLEYAVTYSFWEKRLKTRLLMEKVVEREVRQRISLTPDEVAKFYKENYEGKQQVQGQDPGNADINELIVRKLRRQKSEEAYQLWIKNLRGKYTVDINQPQWKRLTGM
ncbi:MAG: SurA N-terminal domain-containing protein [Thermodesulfobacteriota bacterium]